MIDIPYNNEAVGYYGRWNDTGTSIYSAWQGSQVRFGVSGSSKIVINLNVKDESDKDVAGVVVNVDNGPAQVKVVSAAAEKFTGPASVVFELPDAEHHSIIIKLFGMPESQWSQSTRNDLVSISIDDGGRLLAPLHVEARNIGLVGDSWMATSNDWPHLLDGGRYSAWPVTFGGATMKALSEKYSFSAKGETDFSEPNLGVVVVGAGVNDYQHGVSVFAYGVAAYSLIGKIRDRHPESRIVLLQSPDNVAAGIGYGKYGPALKFVSWIKGVDYLPFPKNRLVDLEWAPDNAHLTYEGLKTYARIIGYQIDSFED